MKCPSVQTWLMQVETLHVKDWPRNMNRHLKKCAACAKTARRLYKIEEGWRSQPVPAECADAKAAFLGKLPTLDQARPEKREKTARRQKRAKAVKIPIRRAGPYRWLAVAAALFVGVIFAGLLLPTKIQASSTDVIDRLIEWDLEMTNADAKERKRLLDDNEADFKKDVLQAMLSDEDRELAEELLDDGRQLANADDPVVEARVVKRIADKLFARAEANDKAGNEREFERCGKHYMRFKEYGYEPMKARITQFMLPEPTKSFEKGRPDKSGHPDKSGAYDKGGHDKAAFKSNEKANDERMMNQRRQVEKIFERPPEHTRPDLNKKFEGFGKKGGAAPPKKSGRK